MVRAASIFVFVVLFLGACSSLPGPVKVQPKEITDGYLLLEKSHKLLATNERIQSTVFARRAQKMFMLADDERGLILVKLHLARLLKSSSVSESETLAGEARQLITLFRPDLAPYYQLFLVESLFAQNKYSEVLRLVEPLESMEDLFFQPSFLAYGVMARIKLSMQPSNKRFQEALNKLSRLSLELEESYFERQLQDPLVASFALYVCGLGESYRGNWQKATDWYMKARKIDQEQSHFQGTADNLFGLGQCASELNERQVAHSYFKRASDIYMSLKDTLSAAEALKQAELNKNMKSMK